MWSETAPAKCITNGAAQRKFVIYFCQGMSSAQIDHEALLIAATPYAQSQRQFFMKIITIITLTLISQTGSFGQHEQINQLTKEGNKTGKWIEYGLNEKPSSIKVYKVIRKKVSAEELFLYDNKVPGQYSKSDSTLEQSIRIGQWITYASDGAIREVEYYSDEGSMLMIDSYSYDDAGIPNVVRLHMSRTSYVIGRRDSIEFNNLTFYEIKRANEFFEIGASIRNLSSHDVTINVFPLISLEVQPNTYILKALDSMDIKVSLKFLPGHVNEVISLKSSEWKLGLEVRGFGYQLTTTDFETEEMKVFNRTFYYHRTGDEYQMEIVREKGGTTLKYLPLSKQQIKIDLDLGNYTLTIVGPFGKRAKKIKIE